MIDAGLLKEYLAAKYIVTIDNKEHRIHLGRINISINQIMVRSHNDFAYFITPENPFSIILSDEENALRHKRFLIMLDEKAIDYLNGYGTDENETWEREKSYLVLSSDET